LCEELEEDFGFSKWGFDVSLRGDPCEAREESLDPDVPPADPVPFIQVSQKELRSPSQKVVPLIRQVCSLPSLSSVQLPVSLRITLPTAVLRLVELVLQTDHFAESQRNEDLAFMDRRFRLT
jgi:hypothetical protein